MEKSIRRFGRFLWRRTRNSDQIEFIIAATSALSPLRLMPLEGWMEYGAREGGVSDRVRERAGGMSKLERRPPIGHGP